MFRFSQSNKIKSSLFDPSKAFLTLSIEGRYASVFQQVRKMKTRLETGPDKNEKYPNTIFCDFDKGPRPFPVTSIQNSYPVKFI